MQRIELGSNSSKKINVYPAETRWKKYSAFYFGSIERNEKRKKLKNLLRVFVPLIILLLAASYMHFGLNINMTGEAVKAGILEHSSSSSYQNDIAADSGGSSSSANYNTVISAADILGEPSSASYKTELGLFGQRIFFIESIDSIPAIDPIESNAKTVNVSFIVYNSYGVNHISSVKVNFTKTGEAVRESTSCSYTNITVFKANFSCLVNMWYFDASGTWDVAIDVKDINNVELVNTTNFTYNSLAAFNFPLSIILWDSITPGSENQVPASGNFSVLENTGNTEIAEGNILVRAIDLVGETSSSYSIGAENFSSSVYSGEAACSGTQLQNDTDVEIAGASLPRGNQSTENVYYCLTKASENLIKQTYSTLIAPWYIKVISSLAVISPALRRKRKKYSLEAIENELRDKYGLSLEDLAKLIEIKEKRKAQVPAALFTVGLGPSESLVKYLKENSGMRFNEIAKLLNRDERTIWTAYRNAKRKRKEKIAVKEKLLIPVSVFADRKLSVLESLVIYLRSLGLANSEIAKLLHKDPRNIYTFQKRAKEKMIF